MERGRVVAVGVLVAVLVVIGVVVAASRGGDDDATPSSAGTPRTVSLSIGSGATALSATLVVPAGTGPFPALVLVPGSGPQDRDEHTATLSPFRDIADGLAARGVATFRFDKRTKVHPAEFAHGGYTVKEEYVDDATAAMRLVAKRAEIDPKRVFLLGHSQGGTVLPRIAQAAPEIHGLVFLAPSVEPFERAFLRQVTFTANLDGSVSADEQAQIEQLQKLVDTVESPSFSTDSTSTDLLGIPASYWYDLEHYDPVATAASLQVPMLFARGENDYQVQASDIDAFRAALGGRSDVLFKSYPGLGHPFVEGPPTPEIYSSGGHVDAHVLDDIADFVKRY